MSYTDIVNYDILRLSKEGKIDKKDISDGYHTIGELYNHRMALTVALCNYLYKSDDCQWGGEIEVYKSRLHSDGTMFDGMFIVVIESSNGQISYHYNDEHWDKFDIQEFGKAKEYDGHTPNDCIERLLNL